jgi:hypothetical protein
MIKEVCFTYRGVDMTVSGIVTPYVPATQWEPSEGGNFEDYSISVNGVDITELLEGDVLDAILAEAKERLE